MLYNLFKFALCFNFISLLNTLEQQSLPPVLLRPKPFPSLQPPCNLPPDFWCDHPETTLKCTGSLKYCDQYRANRYGRRMELQLAFESACPDSQQCVTTRLYPHILSNPHFSSIIDFKAFPWGLAKREKGQVNCHHGERECVGNRLLRCAFNYFQSDIHRRDAIFNCFMTKMMYRPLDPTEPMKQCLDHFQISKSIKSTILDCTEGQYAIELQKFDEIETKRIGPKFVPFIAINGHGHIHMQAYQMLLAEKIHSWNKTLTLIAPHFISSSSCQLPPDFWCSDPTITNTCYTQRNCIDYQQEIWNKPIEIKIIYNSQSESSRSYIFDYLERNFLRCNTYWEIENAGKFVIELEPLALNVPNIAVNTDCINNSWCLRRAYEECITENIVDIKERTSKLMCLLKETGAQNFTSQLVTNTWKSRCGSLPNRDFVINCVTNGQWRHSFLRRANDQRALRPQPPKLDPWVVLNDHSLNTVQTLKHVLHRMICIWYRGTNHDRDFCARCEYEPTHC